MRSRTSRDLEALQINSLSLLATPSDARPTFTRPSRTDANDSQHQACRQRGSGACFLNTGMGIGHPSAWRRLLARLLPMMPAEDQGAVHALHLKDLKQRRRADAIEQGGSTQPPAHRAPSLRMEVDEDAAFGIGPGLTRCPDSCVVNHRVARGPDGPRGAPRGAG